MATFILTQDNINGFHLDHLPVASLIMESSFQRATELAEFLGVDFSDYCECCGQRWYLAEYDAEFHNYYGMLKHLPQWLDERISA